MIPLKLGIRNFLSYRENVPTLDLTGVHVACLCGDNGHGKSALLDAISWCLWGQARGKTHDDLISYGADEARVELEFLARNSRFRAIRSRRRAGGRRRQGASDLQLQALGEAGSVSQIITGNSVRETQGKIELLVGMDYDTFINSAFLLQGRADEFTNKTPADRKAVLSAILGLAAYDRFQTRARERAGEMRSEVDLQAGTLQRIEEDINNIGDPAAELTAVNRKLAEVESQWEQQRKAVEELREKVSHHRRIESQLTQQRAQIEGNQQELNRIEADIRATQAQIDQLQNLLAKSEEIEKGLAELERARRQFADLEAARQQYNARREEISEATRSIEVEKARLDSEVKQLGHKVRTELTPRAESSPTILAELEETRQKIAELTGKEKGIAADRSRLQTLAELVGEAQSVAIRCEEEGKQIKEKLDLLHGAASHTALCPLCQTPLSEDGHRRLSAAYQEEIQEKRALYRNNRDYLKNLEREKGELEKELPRQEQALTRAANELKAHAIRLEEHLRTSESARVELEQVEGQRQVLVVKLQSGSFAEPAQAKLAAAERGLADLAYDEAAFQETVQSIREFEPYNQLKARLDQAAIQLPRDQQSISQNRETLARRQEELEILQSQVREAETTLAELPGLEARLSEASAALSLLEQDRQDLLARRGFIEGEVNRLGSLRTEAAERRARLSATREDQSIYQELANAFGRQGIQAMLIETVVPRLEEEANQLLGRMTDSRMHVKLETQRERRSGSGEPIETLEINVSDEMGARSYEMYSGGEAFRVNLALRIALSRVLSQRTGAPLPTLFIDEGFGTQDASGRERILDVISAIENDFDKIIVITHLDDLKDMFPVRIEVRKEASGSTFWLS